MRRLRALACVTFPLLLGAGKIWTGANHDHGAQQSVATWAGVAVPQNELAQLVPDDSGVLRVPVATGGKLDPLWRADTEAFAAPMEAGKLSTLRVSGPDASSLVVLSTSRAIGTLTSKKFTVSSTTKTLSLRIIGQGSMEHTYALLTVSIDGQDPVVWAKRAPSSLSFLEDMEVDMGGLFKRSSKASIVCELRIVDGSNAQLIGIAQAKPKATANVSLSRSEIRDFKFEYLDSEVSGKSDLDLLDKGLRDLKITPNLSKSYRPFLRMKELGLNHSNVWGVSESVRKKLADAMSTRIYRGANAMRAGMTPRDIGEGNRVIVSEVLLLEGKKTIPRRFHQYLCAVADCAWMIANVRYGEKNVDNLDKILSSVPPQAQCNGKALLLREISFYSAGDIGLTCDYYAGWSRFVNQRSDKIYDSNHAWNLYTFDGGIQTPADVTLDVYMANAGEKSRTTNEMIGELHILPFTPSTVEYFLAGHFGILKSRGEESRFFEPTQILEELTGYKLLPWLQSDVSYVLPLEARFPFVR